MKAFLFVAVLCLAGKITFSQENLIKWNEKQPLCWNDFAGQVNDTSHYHAECFAEIGYSYNFNSLSDFKFDVFVNFIKNISWTKKEYQSEELLKHEQLHFDIAELVGMRMKEALDNYNYTTLFKSEIQMLFDEKKEEYHAMQKRYDEETNHSLNREKQKEWEAYIKNELSRFQPKPSFALNAAYDKQNMTVGYKSKEVR